MTLILIIRTVAQQGHGSLSGQFLNESQREFLPVILDRSVAGVDSTAQG